MSSDGEGGFGADDADNPDSFNSIGVAGPGYGDATDAGDPNSPNSQSLGLGFSGFGPGTGHAGGRTGDDTLGQEDAMGLAASLMADVNAEPAYGNLTNDFPGFVGDPNSFSNLSNRAINKAKSMVTVPNAIKAAISYVAPMTAIGVLGSKLGQYAVDQIGRSMDTYDINQDDSRYAEMGEPTAPAPSTDDEGGGPYERNRNYLLPTPMMASAATVAPSMTDSPQVLTPYVNRKQSWNNGNFILAPISRRQV